MYIKTNQKPIRRVSLYPFLLKNSSLSSPPLLPPPHPSSSLLLYGPLSLGSSLFQCFPILSTAHWTYTLFLALLPQISQGHQCGAWDLYTCSTSASKLYLPHVPCFLVKGPLEGLPTQQDLCYEAKRCSQAIT